MQKDKSATLATNQDQTLFTPDYVVRRLTPTECARLQGFPDDWCEGIPHGDAAEYKMWGNGMALPCALYVMEGVEDYFKELYRGAEDSSVSVEERSLDNTERSVPKAE